MAACHTDLVPGNAPAGNSPPFFYTKKVEGVN